MAVAVALADLPVAVMNDQFRSLIPTDLAAGIDSFFLCVKMA